MRKHPPWMFWYAGAPCGHPGRVKSRVGGGRGWRAAAGASRVPHPSEGLTHSGVQALHRFGIHDDVQELLEAADKDGDGQIDYHEFVQLMRETNAELAGPESDSGLLLRHGIPAA